MLNLEIVDLQKLIQDDDFVSYFHKHEHILQVCQEGHDQFRDSLGWLSVREWASPEQVVNINNIAQEVNNNADVFVMIGIGGSNNAARSVIEAIAEKTEIDIIYAGTTLSPYALNQVLNKIKGKSVYLNCIAKNFSTLEPGLTFRILRDYLVSVYGKKEASHRIICTGSINSDFHSLAIREDYRFLEFPSNIGGRFSAVTSVHLLAMAIAGVDIKSLIQGSKNMEKELRTKSSLENLAYQYALYRNYLYQQGKEIEVLASFEPRLKYFLKWREQLFAESEGKENKGIYPISAEYSEDLHSIGQFIQDGSRILFETFIRVKAPSNQFDSLVVKKSEVNDHFDYLNNLDMWTINEIAFESTLKAHAQSLPCLVIEIDVLDAYHLGQLFYFFEFACYISGNILGVNPFNQPGVEEYKRLMFKALER